LGERREEVKDVKREEAEGPKVSVRTVGKVEVDIL